VFMVRAIYRDLKEGNGRKSYVVFDASTALQA